MVLKRLSRNLLNYNFRHQRGYFIKRVELITEPDNRVICDLHNQTAIVDIFIKQKHPPRNSKHVSFCFLCLYCAAMPYKPKPKKIRYNNGFRRLIKHIISIYDKYPDLKKIIVYQLLSVTDQKR